MRLLNSSRSGVAAAFLGVLLLAVSLYSQTATYNHPELEWRTIKTEHFEVHFHDGTERTAGLVASVAEEMYGPITDLYQYKPDTKVHFIIKDYEDNSNGAAYYYDNKVEIWAPPMNFHLRGTHNWLRDVVTHEFTHIVSLGAARKFTRKIPAFYFQYFGYEKEKRQDVIHGYPNRLVSLPFAGTVVPMWFAEGMAQYQLSGLGNDWWDSFRDMMLRTAVLNDELLSSDEMDVFGSSSLRNEQVYNQGFAFVLYLARTYGENKIAELARAMAAFSRTDFSAATRAVLGKTQEELYREWAEWLRHGYAAGMETIHDTADIPETVFSRGGGNFYPRYNPQGSAVAFLTNRGSGYFSLLDLTVFDVASGKMTTVSRRVDLPGSWSPDGTRLVYGKKNRVENGSDVFDLYIFDMAGKKETCITRGMRARSPSWSSSGKRLVCVVENDGTSNLVMLDTDGKNRRQITRFSSGEKIYTPRFIPESGSIVFTVSETGVGRDIAVIDTASSDIRYLVQWAHDERDAAPAPDGSAIYFSSDSTGIFNVYSYSMKSGAVRRLTHVRGGAFMPDVNNSGRLVCSVFGKNGYEIASLQTAGAVDSLSGVYVSPYWHNGVRCPSSGTETGQVQYSAQGAKSYDMTYSKLLFFPRIVYDYPGAFKIGSYFTGSDVLDKFSVMGGAAVNRYADADLFALFSYRAFAPTLFIEMFHQVRNTKEDAGDYRFDLSEIDVGGDWRMGEQSFLRTHYVFSRYNARMTFDDRGMEVKFPYTYHIGSRIGAVFNHHAVMPTRFSRIVPQKGMSIQIKAEHAWNRFLNGFDVHSNYGTIVEQYDTYSFNRFRIDWRQYFPGFNKRHGIMTRIQTGILDAQVEDFYNFFAGGLDGLKGYPFYSIEGRKMVMAKAAYRAVLLSDMQVSLGFLRLRNAAVSLYGEIGTAWDTGLPEPSLFRRDAGVQVRLAFNAFYTYPLCLFVDVAYGFDQFRHKRQTYGHEYRTYVGLMFDFPD